MSRNVRKRSYGHVRPAKILIRLRILDSQWCKVFFMRTTKTLVKSSLGAHFRKYVFPRSCQCVKGVFGHIRTATAQIRLRIRSDCASAQSDQGLRCPLTESLDTYRMYQWIQCSKCPNETLRMCGMNLNQCILRMRQDTFFPRYGPIIDSLQSSFDFVVGS